MAGGLRIGVNGRVVARGLKFTGGRGYEEEEEPNGGVEIDDDILKIMAEVTAMQVGEFR